MKFKNTQKLIDGKKSLFAPSGKYTWSKKDKALTKEEEELKEDYIQSLKVWMFSALILFIFYIVYEVVLVPNDALLKLLTSGDFETYTIHIIIKSVICFLLLMCFLLSNFTFIIYHKFKHLASNDENQEKIKSSERYKKLIFVTYFATFLMFITVIFIVNSLKTKRFLKHIRELADF